jgi:hypothetical protein
MNMRKTLLWLLLLLPCAPAGAQFDHGNAAWDGLL